MTTSKDLIIKEKELEVKNGLEVFEKRFTKLIKEKKIKIEKLKEEARFKVNSQKKLEESKAIMEKIKIQKNTAKELKDCFYKPVYDFAQLIYKPIKELEDETKKIEDYHKAEQLNWLRKLQEEEYKKRKEIEEKLEREEITLEQAGNKLEKAESKVGAIKGVTTRKVVKIVDFAKVPDEYKIINMPAINEAVLKNGLDVPGTQIVEEKSISNM